MKILNFKAKLRRQDIFKLTSGNSNDNGAGIVNLATSNNLVVKSKIFLDQTSINKPGNLLMGRLAIRFITYRQTGDGIQVYSMHNLSGGLTVILLTTWWLQKLEKDWQYVDKEHRSLIRRDSISGS